MSEKIRSQHLARKSDAICRHPPLFQVTHNQESSKLQYAMQASASRAGLHTEIEIVDEDWDARPLARSRAVASNAWCRGQSRTCGSGRCSGGVALARNSREWQQLVEVCRIVDTVLIDQEAVYAPRASNDRLLLGLKGSLNEYELDLLRHRSLEARRAKARRGELLVTAPVGYRKNEEQRLEKDLTGGYRSDPFGIRSVRASGLGAPDTPVVPRT